MAEKVQLGDKVRCKYTGYEGYAIMRIEHVNGCVQFGLVPKMEKKGVYPDKISIDGNQLEVIGKSKPKKKKGSGGATFLLKSLNQKPIKL